MYDVKSHNICYVKQLELKSRYIFAASKISFSF